MVAGFIAMAWMTLLYFLKQETSGLGLFDPYFCIIVLSAFVYITILHKRDKDLGGALSFKNGMAAGIVTAFMMGLMIGAYKMIYVKYVNPGIVEEVVKQAKSFYETAGGTTEQIKNAEDSARAMYSPFGQFTYGIGITMLLGGLVSLVCSVIMRREKSVGIPMDREQ
jgi:hypothetical protein